MSNLLQAVMKGNPFLSTDIELGCKIDRVTMQVLAEIDRQREANDRPAFDSEQTRILELVRAAAGNDLFSEVDELIGDCMNVYFNVGISMGWFFAKNPEWLLFAQEENTDE